MRLPVVMPAPPMPITSTLVLMVSEAVFFSGTV